jgi:DNA-binding MarR family transcriptional regulator
MPTASDKPDAEPRDLTALDNACTQTLLEALTRVFRLVYYAANSRTEILDLPIAQVRCLNAVGEREGERLIELASRAALTLPAASRTIDKLVRRGLVLRLSDPEDRRAVRLFLTDAGRDLLDRVRRARLAHLEKTIRRLSRAEMEDLLRSLTSLADAAERAQSADADRVSSTSAD